MSNRSELLLHHAKVVLTTPSESSRPAVVPMAVLVAIGTLLYLAYCWALPKPIPGIPYDEAASKSILGNAPELLKFAKENDGNVVPWFIKKLTEKNAPMVQVWIKPFQPPAVIISDYMEIEDLMVRRTKEFNRGRGFQWLFGQISPDFHIAKPSGSPEFKRSMELVRDLMTPKFLNEVSAPQVHLYASNLVALWEIKAQHASGRPFDAINDIFDCVSDMVNGAAMAIEDAMSSTKHQLDFAAALKDMNVEEREDGSVNIPRAPDLPTLVAFHRLIRHQGEQAVSINAPIQHKLQMLTDPSLRNAFKVEREVFTNEIKKALARLEGEGDTVTSALDQILSREKQYAEKHGTKPDYFHGRITDEVFGYYTAGHDTSATSISWMTRYFGDYPEWQERIREELRAAFSAAAEEERQPTANEINKSHLPSLQAFAEETLRMWPPFFQDKRDTMCDTTLLGVPIPKGTEILIPTGGPGVAQPAIPCPEELHSEECRKKFSLPSWSPEDITTFRPDRWLVEGGDGQLSFNSRAGPTLAFGLGPRKCFGQRLAYMQIRNVIALLLWNFRFKKMEGEFASKEAKLEMSVIPKYCYVALERI